VFYWSFAAAVVAGVTQRPLAGFIVAGLWLLGVLRPRGRARAALAAAVLLAAQERGERASDPADAAAIALGPARARLALSGRICGFPRAARFGTSFPFETHVDGRRVRVLVRSALFDVHYGDSLALDGVVVAPRAGTAAYLRAASLAGPVRVGPLALRPTGGWGGEALARRCLWPVHRAMRVRLARALGARAGLPLALALGERGHLDRATGQRFRTLGVSHLLALSGLHLGIVAGWALLAAGLLSGTRRWLAAAAAMALFTGVAGEIASLRRACLMGLALVAARLTHRPAAPMRALGLALALLLALAPRAAFAAGFQLSFAATFAVLLVAGRYARSFARWRGKRRPLRRLAAAAGVTATVSAAVQAFVLPVQLHHFGAASCVGPVATALMLPLVALVMALSLVVAALGATPVAGTVAVETLTRAAGATESLARWAAAIAPPPVAAAAPALVPYYVGLALCWLGARRPVALVAGAGLVVWSFAR
jgi:ComEC/Rec2-related protein